METFIYFYLFMILAASVFHRVFFIREKVVSYQTYTFDGKRNLHFNRERVKEQRHKGTQTQQEAVESDLDQRLVSWLCEPLNAPLGTSAGSRLLDGDLAHPCNSLQCIFQVLFTDVHRQT